MSAVVQRVRSPIPSTAISDLRTSIQELQSRARFTTFQSEANLKTTVDTTLTRRSFCPVAIFGGIVLMQGGPFLTSPWTRTCTLDGEELSFGRLMRARLPLYLCTWFVGFCVAYLLAHVQRFRRNSRTHFWTGVFLASTSLACVFDSINIFQICDDASSIVNNIEHFLKVCQYVTLGWLSVLKLRLATVMTPKTGRAGSAFAILYIILIIWFTLPLMFPALTLVIPGGIQMVLGISFLLLHIAVTVCVSFVFEVSARAVIREAADPDLGADSASQLFQASRKARISAAIVVISGLSSHANIMYKMLGESVVGRAWGLSLEGFCWVIALDVICNTLACIALSGFGESELDCMAIIKLGVSSTAAKRFRQIERKICGVVGDSSGSALVISALMGNANSLDVVERGIARFRCIRWEVLLQRPDVIMGGGPLNVLGPGKDDLYSLSEPCDLGECDAFFSHSWHDNSCLKWDALCCWCDEFKVVHGRFPRLWLDKVCIDQANIEEDLHCLPVFLAGCNTLFILSGSTYYTRLWCVMEMLIYRAMLISDRSRSQPVAWAIGTDSDECQDIRKGWLSVDARQCECFKAEDKERFMCVVRAIPGGVKLFNSFMQNIGQTIERDFVDYDEVHDV